MAGSAWEQFLMRFVEAQLKLAVINHAIILQ